MPENSKKALSPAELELTQKIQLFFPRGRISLKTLQRWNGCSKELIQRELLRLFAHPPKGTEKPKSRVVSQNEILIVSTDGSRNLSSLSDSSDFSISLVKGFDLSFSGTPASESTCGIAVEIRGLYGECVDVDLYISFPEQDKKKAFLSEHQILLFLEIFLKCGEMKKQGISLGDDGLVLLFRRGEKPCFVSIMRGNDGEDGCNKMLNIGYLEDLTIYLAGTRPKFVVKCQ